MSRVVRRVVSASLLLFAYVAAACTTAPASPTTTAPFSQSDLKIGTGDAAVVIGNLLSVNYTGWLYDATKTDLKGGVFDSSIGRQAFTFTIGSGQVIKGWDRGIIGMKVGGVRQLVIPPSLAYGDSRSGAIPPNATLIFEIELLSIQ